MNVIKILGLAGYLETIFIPAVAETKAIAVICHPNPLQGGNNSHKIVQTTAKALSNRGYACYCPNLRGTENSEGKHDYGKGEIDDVLSVAKYARIKHGNVQLLLAGFSFGAFVAARSYERAKANELLLIGTAVAKYPLPIPYVPIDTLIIHGEEDEIIPLSDLLDWLRPQGIPVTVFTGSGHFFHGKLNMLRKVIEYYFQKT